MSLHTLNLLAEWSSRRRREIRQAQLAVLTLLVSLLGMGGGTFYLGYQLPRAMQQRAFWQQRAEQQEQANTPPPAPPFPKEVLQTARLRTMEFNLILMAITRLLPRAATLQEATIAHQPDTGITITLRGSTQGIEPVRLYTERLRNAGLFADVTPLSITRHQGAEPASPTQRSQFEIRLTLPVPSDSGQTPPESSPEGGESP
jgi:hypothetical protein